MAATKTLPTVRQALNAIRSEYRKWRDGTYAGDTYPATGSEYAVALKCGDMLEVCPVKAVRGGYLIGCYEIVRLRDGIPPAHYSL